LFDALSRAEALLANTEETDRAKLVDRLASEYTQLKYLVEKATAENCRIVDSISPVSQLHLAHEEEGILLNSVSTRSKVASVAIYRLFWSTRFAISQLRIFANVSGHTT
jgi:hypothetical protein